MAFSDGGGSGAIRGVDRRRPDRRFARFRGESLVLFTHLLETLFLHVLVPEEGAGGGLHGTGDAVGHALEVTRDLGAGFGVCVGAGVAGPEAGGVVRCVVVGRVVREVLVRGRRRVDRFGVGGRVAGGVAVGVLVRRHGFSIFTGGEGLEKKGLGAIGGFWNRFGLGSRLGMRVDERSRSCTVGREADWDPGKGEGGRGGSRDIRRY